MTDAYTKQLEDHINKLEEQLAKSLHVEWRQAALNKNRWDLHIGNTQHNLATLVHDAKDIHVKGCFWRLALYDGHTSFHKTFEEGCAYALKLLQGDVLRTCI